MKNFKLKRTKRHQSDFELLETLFKLYESDYNHQIQDKFKITRYRPLTHYILIDMELCAKKLGIHVEEFNARIQIVLNPRYAIKTYNIAPKNIIPDYEGDEGTPEVKLFITDINEANRKYFPAIGTYFNMLLASSIIAKFEEDQVRYNWSLLFGTIALIISIVSIGISIYS